MGVTALWQAFIRGPHYLGAEGAAVKLCVERAAHLLRYGAEPLGVVEGRTPAAKVGTVLRRRGETPSVSDEGWEKARAGQLTEDSHITRAMAAALQAMGLLEVEAPGEAEAFCAALVEAGVADVVASDDIDACIYGAPTVLRGLHAYVNCPEKSWAVLVTRRGLLGVLGLDIGLEAGGSTGGIRGLGGFGRARLQ